MSLDFPNSPVEGNTYQSGNVIFTYSGNSWNAANQIRGYTGSAGSPGYTGSAGVSGSGNQSTIVNTYYVTGSPHTWTKDANVKLIQVIAVGGGGGGTGSSTAGRGGGMGGGACIVDTLLLPQLVGNTVTVTVGAGGAGGTYNLDGGVGNTTTFGNIVHAYGGPGGKRNEFPANPFWSLFSTGAWAVSTTGLYGASSGNGLIGSGSATVLYLPCGGGGGGSYASNIATLGGPGGGPGGSNSTARQVWNSAFPSRTMTFDATPVAVSGNAGVSCGLYGTGGAGGGSASNALLNNAGNGGAGGFPGGGGGGAGACSTTIGSAAASVGGAGANGMCVVIQYL